MNAGPSPWGGGPWFIYTNSENSHMPENNPITNMISAIARSQIKIFPKMPMPFDIPQAKAIITTIIQSIAIKFNRPITVTLTLLILRTLYHSANPIATYL
jgi:hypothetical protein